MPSPALAAPDAITRDVLALVGRRFDPAARTGDAACPFTALYWDFLARHRERLRKNPRMVMQVANLNRVPTAERAAIRIRADAIRAERVSS